MALSLNEAGRRRGWAVLPFAARGSPSYPHLVRSPVGSPSRPSALRLIATVRTAQPLLLSAPTFDARTNQMARVTSKTTECNRDWMGREKWQRSLIMG
jgi:hypothetical protein